MNHKLPIYVDKDDPESIGTNTKLNTYYDNHSEILEMSKGEYLLKPILFLCLSWILLMSLLARDKLAMSSLLQRVNSNFQLTITRLGCTLHNTKFYMEHNSYFSANHCYD